MTPKSEWDLAVKAEQFARQRLQQFDDHDSISQADEENVRQWARTFVRATERLGAHALDDAKAKAAARAHVKMRLQVDEQDEPLDSCAEAAARAFDAGLTLYLRLMAGDAPGSATTIGRAGAVITIGHPGAPVSVEYYCPLCAVAQRAEEEVKGNRWPEPWEHEARTGVVAIRELRHGDAPPVAHCCRCHPDEVA